MKWAIVIHSSLKTVKTKQTWQLRYFILKTHMNIEDNYTCSHKARTVLTSFGSCILLMTGCGVPWSGHGFIN